MTAEQLIQIIKEEIGNVKEGHDAYSIEAIRERGNVGEMSNEVMQIISSMGDQVIMDSEDFRVILSEAVATDPEDQGAFWHELLDPNGFFEEAFQGMEQTADDSYDPDLPPLEEGQHVKHCAKCGKKTEHAMGKCVKCFDKERQNSSDA